MMSMADTGSLEDFNKEVRMWKIASVKRRVILRRRVFLNATWAGEMHSV